MPLAGASPARLGTLILGRKVDLNTRMGDDFGRPAALELPHRRFVGACWTDNRSSIADSPSANIPATQEAVSIGSKRRDRRADSLPS